MLGFYSLEEYIQYSPYFGAVVGREAMILGAKAMVMTGYDILTNPELLEKVKKEFQNRR